MHIKKAVCVSLIAGLMGIYSASLWACPCPPCDDCYRITGSYPNCGCEWKCNPNDCEYCVEGRCSECLGLSDMECCGQSGERFCCWEVSCYRCENNECKYICDPDNCEECVDNECLKCGGRPEEDCCPNYGCYNTSTHICCNGGLCNRALCQECNGENCIWKCNLLNCENCVNGNCIREDTCFTDWEDNGYFTSSCVEVGEEYECVSSGFIIREYFQNGDCGTGCTCKETDTRWRPVKYVPVYYPINDDCHHYGCAFLSFIEYTDEVPDYNCDNGSSGPI